MPTVHLSGHRNLDFGTDNPNNQKLFKNFRGFLELPYKRMMRKHSKSFKVKNEQQLPPAKVRNRTELLIMHDLLR